MNARVHMTDLVVAIIGRDQGVDIAIRPLLRKQAC